MSELDDKQPNDPHGAVGGGSSMFGAPGRSTLVGIAQGLSGGMAPAAGGLFAGAGRVLGSLLGGSSGEQGAPAVAPVGAAGGANAPGASITAPPGSPAHRVQTAAAANNVAQVAALQAELLRQQPRTQEVTDGIVAARHWMMERIAAIRDQFEPRVQAARTQSAATPQGGRQGAAPPNGIGAVERIEGEMDTQCTPFLDGLLHGDPQHRYEHTNEITAKVFAAVRLHSVRRALNGIGERGHRAGAEAEAREHGGVATEAWCGAYAFTQMELGGGFDTRWRSNMQGEGGIRGALNYQTQTKWVWSGTQWMSVQAFHASRGSARYYEEVRQAAPAHGIQPGDIVLIDNFRGTNPDHVTTAISFDGRYLTTVGGNQGSASATDEQGVSRSAGAFDITTNPQPTTVTGTNKAARVHGVGRWSIVDYEQHTYSSAPQMPTAPPNSAGPQPGGGGAAGNARGGTSPGG